MYHRHTHLEKVHRSKVSRYVFLDTLMLSIYLLCVEKSPHTALLDWVHGRPQWTSPVLRELRHVGHWAVYTEVAIEDLQNTLALYSLAR